MQKLLFSLLISILATALISVEASTYNEEASTEIVSLIDKYSFYSSELKQSGFSYSSQCFNDIMEYLITFDKHAKLISRDDILSMQYINKIYDAGIGMDIVNNNDGKLICIPYNDSPAFKCGIRYNDELIEVDGYDVRGVSVEDASVLIKGKSNTDISLKLRGINNIKNCITKRKKNNYSTVDVFYSDQDILLFNEYNDLDLIDKRFLIFKIFSFNTSTYKDFLEQLKKHKAQLIRQNFFVIDLRGNTGGDLQSSINIAKLFLYKKNTVLNINKKNKNSKILSANDGLFRKYKVILWQDDMTASSSEVLISSLAQKLDTITIGTKSAGKASVQEIFRLKNGSYLKLTTEKILYPDRFNTWDNIGIEPSVKIHNVYNKNDNTNVYIQKTIELLYDSLTYNN